MKSLLALLIIFLMVAGTALAQDYKKEDEDRGRTSDYDQGPAKDSNWPDIIAETPNYRAFGKAVLGDDGEKFRWKMGPMHYRGRMGKDEVKVFIIGQEGAQDENVSNRSFTGSTGTRMQKFIKYLGINRSYVFMNTFVYTINGQYDESDPIQWLAQNSDSVIVQHRHRMFDEMLANNKGTLKLVIGVGSAGKDSAANWVRHHGGDCWASWLSRGYCKGENDLAGVYVIGVRHPGGASPRNGGESAAAAIRNDFQSKANIVKDLINKNNGWDLPVDEGYWQPFKKKSFYYGYAAVPHIDFAFGTNWRMGERATTSNRRGSHTVQVFSSEGCYNNYKRVNGRCSDEESAYVDYDEKEIENSWSVPYAVEQEMKEWEVPYEMPKQQDLRRAYDYGPGKFAGVLIDHFLSNDWYELNVTQHLSFGPNGMYRGNLENARVLIVADQMSNTDFFSGRALTGAGGQKLQSFLNAMGAAGQYAIIRTLPVDTIDLEVADRVSILENTGVRESLSAIVRKVLAEDKTEIILTVGEAAKSFVDWYQPGTEVVNLQLADRWDNEQKNWETALAVVKDYGVRLDGFASWDYKGYMANIPREDLPFNTRWWMGTTGDRAARGWVYGEDLANYYKVYAPKWSTKHTADPGDMSADERASVELFKEFIKF